MNVTLCITSYQKSALGSDAEKTFQRSGGSFGRGQANDWVLPDPERILSGRHGTVFYRDDGFWLKDESTNGIAVGARNNQIGKGQAIRLHNGLQLFFGEYEAVVALPNPAGASIASTALASQSKVPGTSKSRTPSGNPGDARAGQFHASGQYRGSIPYRGPGANALSDMHDIHKDRFDPLAAFSTGPTASTDPLNASFPETFDASGRGLTGSKLTADKTTDDHGSALEDPFIMPDVSATEGLLDAVEVSTPLLPEDWDATGLPGGAEPQRDFQQGAKQASAREGAPPSELGDAPSVPPRDPTLPVRNAFAASSPLDPPPMPSATTDAGDFLRIFLDAAGMPTIKVDDSEARQALGDLGRMFGSLVQGVMTLAKARADTKTELRLSRTTLRQRDNNPLKIANDAEDALRLMFGPGSGRYLQADQAVNQVITDLQAHQVALISAMQASIEELIKRVAPEHFSAKAGDSGLFKSLGTDSSAWQKYKEFYEQALRDSSGAFKTLLGEHFNESYEDQVQRFNK